MSILTSNLGLHGTFSRDVFLGFITIRSRTTPGPRSTVIYSAVTSNSSSEFHQVSATQPINLVNGVSDIVPSELGDPCLLIVLDGRIDLVTLTEEYDQSTCT